MEHGASGSVAAEEYGAASVRRSLTALGGGRAAVVLAIGAFRFLQDYSAERNIGTLIPLVRAVSSASS